MLNTLQLRRLAENQLGVPATLHNYQWRASRFCIDLNLLSLPTKWG